MSPLASAALTMSRSCPIASSELVGAASSGELGGLDVVAEVLRLGVANVSAIGGGSGTSLIALRGIPRATRESITFWMCLAGVVASVGLVYWLLR